MTVAHVSPTYFGSDSLLGGAERYVTDLAQAMARRTRTRLVTFGKKARRESWGPLEVHIHKPMGYARGIRFNPVSLSFLSSLWDVDVIHCYQPATLVTDLAIFQGWLSQKSVFATDLGGSANFSLWYHLPLWKGLRSLLVISDFNRARFSHLPLPAHVIYGGVDTVRFCPSSGKKGRRFLHVGRLLPHKGIHHLLEAHPPGIGLDVVGPVCGLVYERQLRKQAQGKDIAFYAQIPDNELILKYQTAVATVLPALEDSGFTTVLESFACGTPVIVYSTGSLPEIVEEGLTDFLVAPGNLDALREKMNLLAAQPSIRETMGRHARKVSMDRFTWDTVVERCLQAYRSPSR